MPYFNLALLGFGNVGQALAQLLRDKAADMHNQYGIETSSHRNSHRSPWNGYQPSRSRHKHCD